MNKMKYCLPFFVLFSSCASIPEVQPFEQSKASSLSVEKAMSIIESYVEADNGLNVDSISEDMIVISSERKDIIVACRVGFGDTFRSAKSRFFFRHKDGIWSVRSEHSGRAGIGKGDSAVVELRGVDIPCQSTGHLETEVFNKI